MLNTNAELRLDPGSQTLVAQPQSRPSLKDLAKIKHIFGPSVYVKAFFVPQGITVVTKAFLDDHVTILAQGTVVVEDPDGVKTKYVAPAHTVFQQATRYRCTCIEDAVWYCVHPTEETDQAVLIKRYE
jgi:hypothetical protein